MSQAAPYYPTQSTLPGRAEFKNFGDNRQGFELSPNSGGFIGIAQRVVPTQTERVSLMITALCQCSVVGNNASFEGIGVSVQGYVRDGSSQTPRRTFDNQLTTAGDPALWQQGQWTDWRQVSFVVHLPESVRCDFVDVCLGCNGSSGNLRIAAMTLRSFYGRRYKNSIGISDWGKGAFVGPQIAEQLVQGRSLPGLLHYFAAHPTRIAQGQQVRLSGSMFLRRAFVYSNSEQQPKAFAMILVAKFLRADSAQYDWKVIAWTDSEVSLAHTMTDEVVERDVSFIAENPLRQTEFAIMLYSKVAPWDDLQFLEVNHDGIAASVELSDQRETGRE